MDGMEEATTCMTHTRHRCCGSHTRSMSSSPSPRLLLPVRDTEHDSSSIVYIRKGSYNVLFSAAFVLLLLLLLLLASPPKRSPSHPAAAAAEAAVAYAEAAPSKPKPSIPSTSASSAHAAAPAAAAAAADAVNQEQQLFANGHQRLPPPAGKGQDDLTNTHRNPTNAHHDAATPQHSSKPSNNKNNNKDQSSSSNNAARKRRGTSTTRHVTPMPPHVQDLLALLQTHLDKATATTRPSSSSAQSSSKSSSKSSSSSHHHHHQQQHNTAEAYHPAIAWYESQYGVRGLGVSTNIKNGTRLLRIPATTWMTDTLAQEYFEGLVAHLGAHANAEKLELMDKVTHDDTDEQQQHHILLAEQETNMLQRMALTQLPGKYLVAMLAFSSAYNFEDPEAAGFFHEYVDFLPSTCTTGPCTDPADLAAIADDFAENAVDSWKYLQALVSGTTKVLRQSQAFKDVHEEHVQWALATSLQRFITLPSHVAAALQPRQPEQQQQSSRAGDAAAQGKDTILALIPVLDLLHRDTKDTVQLRFDKSGRFVDVVASRDLPANSLLRYSFMATATKAEAERTVLGGARFFLTYGVFGEAGSVEDVMAIRRSRTIEGGKKASGEAGSLVAPPPSLSYSFSMQYTPVMIMARSLAAVRILMDMRLPWTVRVIEHEVKMKKPTDVVVDGHGDIISDLQHGRHHMKAETPRAMVHSLFLGRDKQLVFNIPVTVSYKVMPETLMQVLRIITANFTDLNKLVDEHGLSKPDAARSRLSFANELNAIDRLLHILQERTRVLWSSDETRGTSTDDAELLLEGMYAEALTFSRQQALLLRGHHKRVIESVYDLATERRVVVELKMKKEAREADENLRNLEKFAALLGHVQ